MIRHSIAPLALCALTAHAQPERLTAADAEAFFDGLIPSFIERSNIAGAVVAVVKDGKVVLQKGYGYADVATKKPVSPDTTLFRPGSISKLFTWTSVMQLVEQGKLDLDKDVNQYLDFKVPAGITLRHIMTHTSGFEETARELFVPSAKEMENLKAYLTEHLPVQIFPAGKVPAYSNYATSLAGYIAQRVSGESFDAYAANHILKPLGMDHTTFVQPLPDPLKPLMSSGYQVASKPAKDFEFVKAYPAGSVATTAADMTRFMIAHLNDGRFGDIEILKPETAKLMHARQASAYPAMNAMALGFYETSRNGHRIIAHGGDTQWFHSNLELILDANTGLFISQNSAGSGGDLRGVAGRKFTDRYFPGPALKKEALTSAKQDAQAVAGYYIVSRRVDNGFPRATSIGELHIVANDDGTITGALREPSGELKKLKEVEPFVFRDETSEDRLAFRKDDQGRWEVNIGYPFMVFTRVSFWDHQITGTVAIGFGIGVIALTILGWPVAAALRWHYGRKLDLDPTEARLRRWVFIFCVFEAAFFGGWALMANVANDITKLGPPLDAKQHLTQALGAIAALGIPVALYAAIKMWSSHAGTWWFAKLRFTAIALALTSCTWFAWHWQLLNFSTKY